RCACELRAAVNPAAKQDADKAAKLAREHGVRIHTVAFGGDVAGLFGLRPPDGAAEIDEAALAHIAAITGGRAFRARDTDELAGIYAEIDRLEPVQRPGEAGRPPVERYPWPPGAALLVGVLATWQPRRRAEGAAPAAAPSAAEPGA